MLDKLSCMRMIFARFGAALLLAFMVVGVTTRDATANTAPQDNKDDVCEWLELTAEKWRKPRIATKPELFLFEQCAFSLTRLEDFDFSLSLARMRFSPYLLPRAMHDALRYAYDIKEQNDARKLNYAVTFLSNKLPFDVRRTAVSWLIEIVISESSCQILASYALGKTALDPLPPQIVKESDVVRYLHIAAIKKYPPAMMDYGRYLLEKPSRDDDHVSGYGYLLAAQERGEAVDTYIRQFCDRLSPTELKNADIRRGIYLMGSADLAYLECSS